MVIDADTTAWYVIRATYSRELKVKSYLEGEGIECFVPMRDAKIDDGEQIRHEIVPAVHNLIFVHSTREKIQQLKTFTPLAETIRYAMDSVTGEPMIVPDKQMEDFIAVSSSYDKPILYLSPDDIHLNKGDRVRITGGIWKGVEGRFVRIKRGLRVVVEIKGVMVVATASLHPSMVEKID